MRAITKAFAAAAVAITAGALATTASASVFVSVAGSNSLTDNSVSWTHGATAGTGTISTNGAAPGVLEHINFNDIFYNDGGGQDAYLTISATANGVAVVDPGPTYKQTGVNGFFEFRAVSDPTVVLLRGVFTNAWITGKANAGSFMSVDPSEGGTLTFTSDVATINGVTDPSFSFAFSGVHPSFGVTGGKLNNFTSTGVGGTFSAAVPEPATWALMIVGFGGAGAMLRSRRQKGLATA